MAHTRLFPLLRWGRKPGPAPTPEPDFGDHGTAFGLDLSLAPALAAAPAEPATPPAPGHATPLRGEPSSLWRRAGGRRPWRDG